MINFGISCKDALKYVYVSDSNTGEAYSIPFKEMLIVTDSVYEKKVSFKSYDTFWPCDIHASYDCITDGYKVLIKICGVSMWDYSQISYENVVTSLSKLIKNGIESVETNVYLLGRQFYIAPTLELYTDTLVKSCETGKYIHNCTNTYYVAQWSDTATCRDTGLYFHVYPTCDSSNFILACRSLVGGFSFFVVFDRETSRRVVTGGGNFFDFVFLDKTKIVECRIGISHNNLLINNIPFVMPRGEAKHLKKFLSRLVDIKV